MSRSCKGCVRLTETGRALVSEGPRTVSCFLIREDDGQLWARVGGASGHMDEPVSETSVLHG